MPVKGSYQPKQSADQHFSRALALISTLIILALVLNIFKQYPAQHISTLYTFLDQNIDALPNSISFSMNLFSI